jgi:hypothetical protein
MVSISLFVETLRTRPRALLWAMAALQVVLWTLVPAIFYSAPPGQLPQVLAIGRWFQWGTEYGPPVAFWLAEIAYQAAGLAGVYLLSQICIAITYWFVFLLGRSIVGNSQAVMAVLLMAGIAVFSLPTVEFGPEILATPLWALMLLHYWRAVGQGQGIYWLALGFEAAVLVLTAYTGLILIGLLLVFTLVSAQGRAQLATVYPWLGGVAAIALLFPHLIWLDRGGGAVLVGGDTIVRNLRAWGWLIAALILGHLGMAVLIALASGFVISSRGTPAQVVRAPLAAGAREFVYFFALAPIIALGLFVLFSQRAENLVAIPAVVLSGLAVIVAAGDDIRIENQYAIGYAWAALMVLPPLLTALAIVLLPWTFAIDLRVAHPAVELGAFFADSFQRRTGRPLAIVAGDPPTAALVALAAPSRPSLYIEGERAFAPALKRQDIEDNGAVVVWPSADAGGQPPPEIKRQFPDLVPEVPRAFERRFQGLMPLLRIGWGVIRPRPKSAQVRP